MKINEKLKINPNDSKLSKMASYNKLPMRIALKEMSMDREN
jgi:hypothetical protein